jgi:hypothetical protein
VDALEARARWHLEIGYWSELDERDDGDEIDDDRDGEYMGHVTCWQCGGSGTVLDCCDDLCHGQDWCMHGRNLTCKQCDGRGSACHRGDST